MNWQLSLILVCLAFAALVYAPSALTGLRMLRDHMARRREAALMNWRSDWARIQRRSRV